MRTQSSTKPNIVSEETIIVFSTAVINTMDLIPIEMSS